MSPGCGIHKRLGRLSAIWGFLGIQMALVTSSRVFSAVWHYLAILFPVLGLHMTSSLLETLIVRNINPALFNEFGQKRSLLPRFHFIHCDFFPLLWDPTRREIVTFRFIRHILSCPWQLVMINEVLTSAIIEYR